jgi:hypothetical protein
MSYWSKRLIEFGDPVEKEGCGKYSLHERFPRYAEIWGPYVYRNRDPKDYSKLREDFPIELENLFNHHYGVWFHFTTAYRQIEALSQYNKLVDISDPLFHLATAIDLIESTFVIALEIRLALDGAQLSHELSYDEYHEKTEDFWKGYTESFKKWAQKHTPIQVRLHSVSDVFDEHTKRLSKDREARKKARGDYNRVSDQVRHYRNVLTHNLSPLRIIDKETGKIRIPEEGSLTRYGAARWSSDRSKYESEHYELAEVVIGDLAEGLVLCTNEIWEMLLEVVQEIALSERYEPWFTQKDEVWNYDTSQRMWNYNRAAHEQNPPSGGSIIWFPTKPSAYNDG